MGRHGPRHAVIGHTADVGISARAADVAGLLAEAAAALAEVATTVDAHPDVHRVPVAAAGDDLEALAFDWLNGLIGMADAEGAALIGAVVDEVRQGADGWSARGRALLAPYGAGVRARIGVKAATFHGLRAEREKDEWWLQAYLDV